jgi:peptidoglycan hydrolase-like protein with peptidoglycan-binding domain
MDARMVIVGSVGDGGSNQTTDVRVVQRLLNDWLVKVGQSQLKIDGLVGTKTIGAIIGFQKACIAIADGRVDAGGRTINLLFNQHLSRLFSAIDVSTVAIYVDIPALNETSISDPMLVPILQSYIVELRKSA